MTYQEVLDFLYSQLPMFQRVGAKALNHDLGKTIELHAQLGNPQLDFKSIHIAGTNGKGSTAHFLASILNEGGYKVGLYTSPHLKSFRERIRINGQMVPEQFIVDFVSKNEALVHKIKPSFFEMTVAMAYQYFADEKVDFAIVEAGLGGRLDSTNIITPEVSVITSIGLDHQDILGETVEEIAREKAGIIKQKIPVVLGKMDKKAEKAIVEVAKRKQSAAYQGHDRYAVLETNGNLEVKCEGVPFLTELSCDLKGESPLFNLPVVLQTIDLLKGYKIDQRAIQEGISHVCSNTGLLGRWQVLSSAPLTICDIGHNESAVQLLVDRLYGLNKPMRIVWGMNGDKAVDKILLLLPGEAKYYFCAAKIDRALPAIHLQTRAADVGLKGESYGSVMQAYKAALNEGNEDELIFIGGSTFVVAELENLLNGEK